MNHNRICPY